MPERLDSSSSLDQHGVTFSDKKAVDVRRIRGQLSESLFTSSFVL